MNRRDLFKGLAAGAVAPLALNGDLTPEIAKKSEKGRHWSCTDGEIVTSHAIFTCSAVPFDRHSCTELVLKPTATVKARFGLK